MANLSFSDVSKWYVGAKYVGIHWTARQLMVFQLVSWITSPHISDVQLRAIVHSAARIVDVRTTQPLPIALNRALLFHAPVFHAPFEVRLHRLSLAGLEALDELPADSVLKTTKEPSGQLASSPPQLQWVVTCAYGPIPVPTQVWPFSPTRPTKCDWMSLERPFKV